MSETPMPGMAKPATPTPLLGPSVVVPGGVVVAPAVAAVAAATVPAATVNAAAAAASLASGNPNGGSSTSVAAAASQPEPDMKGWLLKWTNYLKGYQKRWFVLSKGVLSYYRCVDVTTSSPERACVSLCSGSLCCFFFTRALHFHTPT